MILMMISESEPMILMMISEPYLLLVYQMRAADSSIAKTATLAAPHHTPKCAVSVCKKT